MEGQAVSDRGHGQLSHTEMQVPPGPVCLRKVSGILHIGLGGRRQVRRAADQCRDRILDLPDQHTGQAAGGLRRIFAGPIGGIVIKLFCDVRIVILVPEALFLRVCFLISCEHPFPDSSGLCSLLGQAVVMRINLIRYVERFGAVPAQRFFHCQDIRLA